MIQVEKIRVQEFRGIRDLTIDFKSKNFAICGPNGTGKSGIVDALEFGLTGDISRLSGAGMGDVSVKDHAPHVDSRNRPDKCLVTLTIKIPQLGKTATIERSVKNSQKPTIIPADGDIIAVVKSAAQHPEFALSRRELIRYVISTPGDRANEVQALLRLESIGKLREVLLKISNAATRAVEPSIRERSQAQAALIQALGITGFAPDAILKAVNERRVILGLGPLTELTATTSFRDGISSGPVGTAPSRVPKAQAVQDLAATRDLIEKLTDGEGKAILASIAQDVSDLLSDPAVAGGATKEAFLNAAIDQILDEEKCPVCDTPWDIGELKALIAAKLKKFEEATARRDAISKKLSLVTDLLSQLNIRLSTLEGYGPLFNPMIDVAPLNEFRKALNLKRGQLDKLFPLAETLQIIETFGVPATVTATIEALQSGAQALPEPSQQDAAREFLIISQERLEAYRGIATRTKQAEEQADRAKKIHDIYAKVSTKALEEIYQQVEKEFSDLYSFINKDDEDKFTAKLVPSLGKLGFDVDFYGRGYFPPGAYHSEGHQDGMGLCLYLALMKHLLKDDFRFAVLDDVVMSVDAGHRRQVCSLLREKFPETQFILTTHDEIWLRHMKSAGLIEPKSSVHFKNWQVEHGPTEWEDRDIWQQIDDALKGNDVRRAAGLLRHYLEYISAEICSHLRAPVEFRGDAQFQLGDLLPSAVGQLGKLFREGKNCAESWAQKDRVAALTATENDFKNAVKESNVDQWQVNTAIHYNEWENLQKADFEPVVAAYRKLLSHFICSKDGGCGVLLSVVPERGSRKMVTCSCGKSNINLEKK